MAELTEKTEADIVLVNGKIVTLDPEDSIVEAVAIKNGRIVEVGDRKKVEKLMGRRTKVIDLNRRMATPGLIDTHCHIASSGVAINYHIDLSYPKVKSIAHMVKIIERRTEEIQPGEWIEGRGWDEALLDEKRYPTRWDLDPVSPRNPVVLRHTSGHYLSANSYALKLAKIGRETPQPNGGRILKDPASNEPTGVLKEPAACEQVSRMIPRWTVKQFEEGITMMSHELFKEGITAAKDGGTSGYELEVMSAYKNLVQREEPMVRVYLLWRCRTVESVHQLGAHLTKKPNDMLKMGGIKLFLDGTLMGKTAWTYEEYWNQEKGQLEEENTGYPVISIDAFEELVRTAHNSGYQVCVHAIGDRAVDATLDAFEKALDKNPRRDHRHSIIHAIMLRQEAIDRIMKTGTIIETQSPFLYFLSGGYYRAVRPERLRKVIPLRSFIGNGIIVGNGSDSPVCPFPPRYGLWAACTRKSIGGDEVSKLLGAEEKITISEALRTYTIWAAKCLLMEDVIGSIEVGKYADMVIWSQDLYSLPVEDIKDAKVSITILGGKIVYSAS